MSEWVQVTAKKSSKKASNTKSWNRFDNTDKLCHYWKKKGFCSKSCKFYHPIICKNINRNGFCNDRNCTFFHPSICKNINKNGFCNDKDCTEIHTIVCGVWIKKGYCLCFKKDREYHPRICELNEKCNNDHCKMFHTLNEIVYPDNFKSLKCYTTHDLYNIDLSNMDDDFINFLSIQTSSLMLYLNIALKERNVQLVEWILSNFRCDIRDFTKDMTFSPFNYLAWGYLKHEEDAKQIKNIIDLLIRSDFKLLSENKKFSDENIFKVLQLDENPMHEDVKKDIVSYCLHSIGDEKYWFKIAKAHMQKLSNMNTSDFYTKCLFTILKCPFLITEHYCKEYLKMASKMIADDTTNVYSYIFHLLFSYTPRENSEFDHFFASIDIDEIRRNITSYIVHNISDWKDIASRRNSSYMAGYISILAWIYKADPVESLFGLISDLLSDLSCSQFIDWLDNSDVSKRLKTDSIQIFERVFIDSFFKVNYFNVDTLSNQDRINAMNWFESTNFYH